MRNKLIFLVQYIQVCRDFEVFGNIRFRKARLFPQCPQSLASFFYVIFIPVKCLTFLHLCFEERLLVLGIEATRIVRINARVFAQRVAF